MTIARPRTNITIACTQQWPYSIDIELGLGVYESARASRSVRWRRRCLSTCRACSPSLSLSCLSLPVSLGPRVSAAELRLCPDRAPKTPMRRSTPSSSLIVGCRKLSTWRWWSEHNAPAGGFSTSIAQSSGRAGRRDLAPHPHEKPSSRLRDPTENRTAGYFPGATNFARRGARTSHSAITRYTCEFAFQVPVDVRTVGFMRD